MKDLNLHKLKFSPYLEKLYQSDKPLIIYKVKDGYNLYTDFSKKIVLTNHNIDKFFNFKQSDIELISLTSWEFILEVGLKMKKIKKNEIKIIKNFLMSIGIRN